MNQRAALRVGLIGDGGISRSVRATLNAIPDRGAATSSSFDIRAILSRRPSPNDARIVTDLDSLLAERLDVVVECASHEAVAAYGATVLGRGIPLVVVSIGALSDATLHNELRDAAMVGGTQMILASGAIGGIDALAAARLGGLERVCYRGRKPPLAWAGTPAERILDLATLSAPETFYRGNARDAARVYPRNSNVAATVALAGLGFERTEVELVADPTIQRNVHELFFEGGDGRFEMTLSGMPSPENPKTSMLTAHSVARTLISLRSPVVI